MVNYQAMPPLVGVIIPTHKRPHRLIEALDSVYAQEGAGVEFQMEVFVVYDVPTDVTGEIKARYPAAHFLQQTGRGPSAARNIGIKAAKGKYIAFLDDDNLWLPHRLRTQVPVLESRPEIGVLYGQVVVTGDADLSAWPASAPSGHVFEAFLTMMDDFIATDTLLIRREAFEKAGYFDESIPTDEHYDLCLRLAFYFQFLFLLGPIAHGRFSKNEGLWHTSILNGAFEQTLPRVIEKALAMLPDRPDSEALKRRARLEVVRTIARQQWEHNGIARVRSYLLDALRLHPWMIREPAFVENICRSARELAKDSASPITAVKEYWKELNDITHGSGTETRSQMRLLLADLLVEAAFGLGNRASFLKAGYAAALASFYDPAWFRRKLFFSRLARSLAARSRQKLSLAR
jgi:glycosyltransferase involved in cell wall biosynthesis